MPHYFDDKNGQPQTRKTGCWGTMERAKDPTTTLTREQKENIKFDTLNLAAVSIYVCATCRLAKPHPKLPSDSSVKS